MPKNFFKNDSERKLWIKLNAERLLDYRIAHGFSKHEIGSVDEPYTPMWVSSNQLEFDENEREAPRFSFEELIMFDQNKLKLLEDKRNFEYQQSKLTFSKNIS